jgi:hypothetical protein
VLGVARPLGSSQALSLHLWKIFHVCELISALSAVSSTFTYMVSIGGRELKLAADGNRLRDFHRGGINHHHIFAAAIHHDDILRVRVVDDGVWIFADLDVLDRLERRRVECSYRARTPVRAESLAAG